MIHANGSSLDTGHRTIAVIIAFSAPDTEQVRNLRTVLDAFSDTNIEEVFIIEQRTAREAAGSPLSSIVRQYPRVHFRSIAGNSKKFLRASLVNQAAQQSSADYLWIHRADLLLPFPAIASEIRNSRAAAIKPFSHYIKTDRRQSEKIICGNDVDPDLLSRKKPKGKSPGSGSFIVERNLFLTLGGLNERFVGEGDEGIEFMRRLRMHFRDLHVYREHIGILLHRSESSTDTKTKNRSRILKDRMVGTLETDLSRYYRRALKTSLPFDHREIQTAALRRQRGAILGISCHTPPPCIPASMPGELWGITTYYNPAGYRIKKRNYQLFRQGIAAQRLPLLTVELAFNDTPFELSTEDADILVQLRATDILWQKERLLNIGLKHLPRSCDKVVWLDCDVLFANNEWPQHTSALLDEYTVVQPFSLSVRLGPDETGCATDDLPIGNCEHQILHGMAYGHCAHGPRSMSNFISHGHSGYAWAIRRSIIEKHGWYDANILGNADLNMAHAMFGGCEYLKVDRLSAKARDHLESWARRFYLDVQGSVGYTDGTLFHLWHGDKKNRLYEKRLSVLIDNDYDPQHDIARAPNGTLYWSSHKPALHAWCQEYFSLRCEDRQLHHTPRKGITEIFTGTEKMLVQFRNAWKN